MILSHIPLTCLNVSSYRAIWTNFRQHSMCFEILGTFLDLYGSFLGQEGFTNDPEPYTFHVFLISFNMSSASGYIGAKYFQELGPRFFWIPDS